MKTISALMLAAEAEGRQLLIFILCLNISFLACPYEILACR